MVCIKLTNWKQQDNFLEVKTLLGFCTRISLICNLNIIYKLYMILKYILTLTFYVYSVTSKQLKYTREIQQIEQYNDFLKIHKKKYSDTDEYMNHFHMFLHNLSRLKNYKENGINCKQYLTTFSDVEYNAYYDSCKGLIFPDK